MKRRRAMVALVVLSLSSVLPVTAQEPTQVAAPAPPPPDLAAYRALTVGSSARSVGPVSVKHGRLEIEMRSGVSVPILAGGQVVGFQLQGDGTWRYAVDDVQERQVFAANVERTANLLTVTPDRILDNFTTAIVLFGQPAYEAYWSGEGRPGAVPSGAAAELRSQIELLELSWNRCEHYLPESRDGAGQYVYAEFQGKARIGYQYDGVRSGYETLFAFRQFSGVARRYTEDISVQPADRGHQDAFVLEHADLRLATADNRSGTIEGMIRLAARRDGARIVELDLLNHRDPKTERWNSDRNALVVQSVEAGTGGALAYSHRYGELLVDLGTPVRAGSKVEIRFAARGDFFTASGGYRDDNYLDFGLISWFPIPEQRSARRFTFTLEARTKKPFRPVSSGDELSLAEEGDQFVLKAKSDVPVWQVALFAGKYTTHEIKDPRWTIRAHGYGLIDKKDVEQIAGAAATFMGIFEARLGPCPFKEIDVVELPTFWQFGISPPGLVMLTSNTFKPRESAVREYLSNHGANALIAHELAHQWFGHKAWETALDDNWLSESISEYLSGIAMGIVVQQADVNKAKLLDFKQMLAIWRTWGVDGDKHGTVAGANRLSGENGWVYRFYLLYNKGPLVLHMFRTLIGDERFVAVLRAYLDDANVGPTSYERFLAAVKKVLGQDFSWFFDQWMSEPGIPQITVAHQVRGTALAVDVKQEPRIPFKKIHIPLLIEYPDGKREVKLAFQEQPQQHFEFPLKGAPARVLVDPGRNNLADYK